MVLAHILNLLLSLFGYYHTTEADFSQTLHKLSYEVEQFQAKKQTTSFPPFLWEHDKGIYKSEVKLNFHGEFELAEIREYFAVYDNNMFATAWITSCLIEAQQYGVGPQPKADQLNLAVEAIGQYHNHNYNFNNSIMTFWPQKYFADTDSWQSTPSNLLSLFELSNDLPITRLEQLLKFLGLKDLEKVMERLMSEKKMFEDAFHIPPDFDDTFVNIGLGSLLFDVRDKYPQAYESWRRTNTNMSSAIAALKKYAYRPMSDDLRINTIDPRTYFYLRDFIQNASQFGQLALVPTWVQDTIEVRSSFNKGVAMPFNINNVDVTVATNTIYGMTAALLNGFLTRNEFDDDLKGIYLNTSMMIVYEMETNFTSRRDLALTYYPSKFECYWFTARTYFIMKSYSVDKPLPWNVMLSVFASFKKVLRGHVTSDIVKSAKSDTEGRVYFDDFLGDGDLTSNNKSRVLAEDRIFTTSMAVNTLFKTWTIFNKTSKHLQWEDGTPQTVKDTVKNACIWLNEHVLGGTYKPWNAFFSGSGKDLESLPFVFPANRREFLNGTAIHGNLPHGVPFLLGFEGIVPEDQYNQMLTEMKTPLDFWGFNSDPHGYFPFWSSDAYTYATTMLALSQYLNIQ